MDEKTAPEQANGHATVPFSGKGPGLHFVKKLSISKLKIFLGALAFSFFAKGFTGSYTKSMVTQIERRFEISSSINGLIDGSFEIGNLVVLILVSYLGSRIHRPKAIAIGCLIMAIGAFIAVTPHFIMGRYNYNSVALLVDNSSTSVAACVPASPPTSAVDNMDISQNATRLGCENHRASYLWLFVLFGNVLRGIGEAPIMPLGLSYIDDFAREENSALYIGGARENQVGPNMTLAPHFQQANKVAAPTSGQCDKPGRYIDDKFEGYPLGWSLVARTVGTCEPSLEQERCMWREAYGPIQAVRHTFLGLVLGLKAPSYLLAVLFFLLVKKTIGRKETDATENQRHEDGNLNEDSKPHGADSVAAPLEADKETSM
uniref:Uncharacterized protein n=1 Tax=Sphaerodactylus townsendi TaxID=933632 RepID=A0ACB8FNM1_9SAUR